MQAHHDGLRECITSYTKAINMARVMNPSRLTSHSSAPAVYSVRGACVDIAPQTTSRIICAYVVWLVNVGWLDDSVFGGKNQYRPACVNVNSPIRVDHIALSYVHHA